MATTSGQRQPPPYSTHGAPPAYIAPGSQTTQPGEGPRATSGGYSNSTSPGNANEITYNPAFDTRGESGIEGDNRSMLYYVGAFVGLIVLEIIASSMDGADELAVLDASQSGVTIEYRFGMTEVEVDASISGLSFSQTEDYDDLCDEVGDDNDFEWCVIEEKGNAWVAFSVLAGICWLISIICISIIVICGPKGCCTCGDNCCSWALDRNKCNGNLPKNTAVWSLVANCIFSIAGCIFWMVDHPLEDEEVCDDVDSCEVTWGSTWWMAIFLGLAHLGVAIALASPNTWGCK